MQSIATVADAADPFEQAALLMGLAALRMKEGELHAAAELAERAVAAFTRLGAPLGMVQSNYVLAAVRKRQGRADEAAQSAQRGLDIAQSAGLPTPEGWLLNVWA